MSDLKPSNAPRKGSPKRNTARNGTDKRREILSAAMRIFARQGYDGASLQQIANLAGVAQPLINYYFGSKESLWREAVDRSFLEMARALQTFTHATQGSEPIDQIRILIRVLLHVIATEPDIPLIILNETRHPSARLDWLVDNYIRKLNVTLDDILERGHARGQIRRIRPIHFTNTILATISQICIAKPLYETMYPDQVEVMDTEAHAEELFQILLEGIMP